MHVYFAFGLKIHSDIELPELSRSSFDGPCDLEIAIGRLDLIVRAIRSYHEYGADRQVLVYPEVGAFVIEGVHRIVVEPKPEVAPGLLAFPLLGPVMGLLLHLRGLFVLHASAVALNGRGVGFLGDKGAGKSTLAATLLKTSGAALLTDDLLVFNDSAEILAAFPQVKLAPDAMKISQGMGAQLRPPPIEDFPKHQIRLSGDTPASPVPGAALFELRRDHRTHIEPLSQADALKMLIRFCYISRFADRPLEQSEHKRLFQQAASVVTRVKTGRLFVPDTLDQLPLAQAVVAAAMGQPD